MNKDLRKIIKALEDQGFEVVRTKRGHLTVTRDGAYVTTMPGTPSDWRSVRNSLAAARRAGFRWPPQR